jgi:hypothetical protein
MIQPAAEEKGGYGSLLCPLYLVARRYTGDADGGLEAMQLLLLLGKVARTQGPGHPPSRPSRARSKGNSLPII